MKVRVQGTPGDTIHSQVMEQTMPTPCYISIEGQTQGNITAGAFTSDSVGNIYVEGHEDEVLVQEFSHVVTCLLYTSPSPRD